MRRDRSVRHLVVWSACAGLALAACGSSGSDMNGAGGSVGSGGSSQTGGAPGTGGTTPGSGGSGPGTGGHVGTGGAGTGGVTGTGGRTQGSGGATTGGGGQAAGTGGGGGGAKGTGGAGNSGAGGAGGAGSAGSAGSAGMTAGMSSGCGKAPTIPSSSYNNGKPISITAANMMRRYILSVPTNYDNMHPYKLVIAFHQRDGNDIEMYDEGYYSLQPLANDTTIFVAPNGQLNNAPCSGTGKGQSMCGWPNPNNTDFALADAVVAQVEENFCVDTNRIFATGWSYGGAMSYETSCARPLSGSGSMDYLRAIAVYSGSPSITAGPCPPTKPVAYYASHGTQDNVLPYSGGVSMAQNYATANGCTWVTPTMVTSGNHVCANMMGCMTGYPVEFCSFNGPHTPTPTDPGQTKSWEAQNVWTFFTQF